MKFSGFTPYGFCGNVLSKHKCIGSPNPLRRPDTYYRTLTDAYTGNTNYVYCAEPHKTGHWQAGSYSLAVGDLTASSDMPWLESLNPRAILWFSKGAPGFDDSMWRDLWEKSSEAFSLNYDDFCFLMAHVYLAEAVSGNSPHAMSGMNAAQQSWTKWWILGLDNGHEVNMVEGGSLRYRIFQRADEVPSNDVFHVFTLNRGQVLQTYLSYDYQPKGYAKLHKTANV